MNLYTLDLANLRADQAPVAGAKAALLGAALAHGEAVPPGFVLGAMVFEDVLTRNELMGDLDALYMAARTQSPGWEEQAIAFSEALSVAQWPAHLKSALVTAMTYLPAGPVVVRSSATVEDTEKTACAGLFQTALRVTIEDLPEQANRCWAAAFRPEVFVHLLTIGIDPAELKVPLLVQPMLTPSSAGVLFTTDPDDPERRHFRLAFAAGHGETVVQGDGGTDVRLLKKGPLPAGLPLDAALLKRLRELAARIEKKFGRAMDLEWAAVDGTLWLLQVRPIGGLPAGTEKRPAIRWSRNLATERFPDPISPLGWTALQSALRVNLQTLDRRFGLQALRPEEVATVIGGYVYNNRDFFAIPQSMRFRPAAHLPYAPGYLKVLMGLLSPRAIMGVPALFKPRTSALGSAPNDPRFRAIAGLFDQFLFKHALDVESQWLTEFPQHLEAMDALSAQNVTALETPALLDYARRVIARSDAFMEPDLAIYVIKMACRWAVEEVGAMVDGRKDPALLATLTGGLASNATIAMNESLEHLHAAAAEDQALAAALASGRSERVAATWAESAALSAREGFLRDYGHVTLSWDIRHPTYLDRPELLDDLLAQRLRAGDATPAEARREALAQAREAETRRIANALGSAPWAKAFFMRLLNTLHTFMRLDEEHHLYCGRLIPAERRIVAELAGRMVALGAFDNPDDIHFLTLDEVFALAAEPSPWSRRRLVALRRSQYERAIAQRPIEEYHGHLPVSVQIPARKDGAIQGVGASAGTAEGKVRVVASMADMAAFQPGEILVVPTPKPSYTPLFAVAAGLVTARGSTLSHGLISAREYGLPAVTEVHDALDRLKTGQRVRVDGHTGTITILTSQPIKLGKRLKGRT